MQDTFCPVHRPSRFWIHFISSSCCDAIYSIPHHLNLFPRDSHNSPVNSTQPPSPSSPNNPLRPHNPLPNPRPHNPHPRPHPLLLLPHPPPPQRHPQLAPPPHPARLISAHVLAREQRLVRGEAVELVEAFVLVVGEEFVGGGDVDGDGGGGVDGDEFGWW